MTQHWFEDLRFIVESFSETGGRLPNPEFFRTK
jgi:hypothetical protein